MQEAKPDTWRSFDLKQVSCNGSERHDHRTVTEAKVSPDTSGPAGQKPDASIRDGAVIQGQLFQKVAVLRQQEAETNRYT